MYNVQCTVHNVQCTVFSVQYTLYTVYCENVTCAGWLPSIPWPFKLLNSSSIHSLQGTYLLCAVYWSLWKLHLVLYNLPTTLYTNFCTGWSSGLQYSSSNSQLYGASGNYPLSPVHCTLYTVYVNCYMYRLCHLFPTSSLLFLLPWHPRCTRYL